MVARKWLTSQCCMQTACRVVSGCGGCCEEEEGSLWIHLRHHYPRHPFIRSPHQRLTLRQPRRVLNRVEQK